MVRQSRCSPRPETPAQGAARVCRDGICLFVHRGMPTAPRAHRRARRPVAPATGQPAQRPKRASARPPSRPFHDLGYSPAFLAGHPPRSWTTWPTPLWIRSAPRGRGPLRHGDDQTVTGEGQHVAGGGCSGQKHGPSQHLACPGALNQDRLDDDAAEMASAWLCIVHQGLLPGGIARLRDADQHVPGPVAARTTRRSPLPAKTHPAPTRPPHTHAIPEHRLDVGGLG
jgi:hypothetical protein